MLPTTLDIFTEAALRRSIHSDKAAVSFERTPASRWVGDKAI